jgi:hypothetical protein
MQNAARDLQHVFDHPVILLVVIVLSCLSHPIEVKRPSHGLSLKNARSK